MSQIEIPYSELLDKMKRELLKYRLLVLATSDGEKVTARTVRCIPDGLKVYIATNKNSIKWNQVKANPNVALAGGNLQIEGVASLKGQVSDDENKPYLESFEKIDSDRYNDWENRGHFTNPLSYIIEINPTKLSLFISMPKPEDTYISVLDIETQKAYKLTRKGEKVTF
jgi:general stress protein 26